MTKERWFLKPKNGSGGNWYCIKSGIFFAEIKSFERHILSTHIWSESNFVNVEIPEISKFAIEILFS